MLPDFKETLMGYPFSHAHVFYGKMQALGQTPGYPELARDLCKNDLFFLLTAYLRRPDAYQKWCYDRCREVQSNPDGYLDLWSREFYKDLADDTPMLTATRGWVTHGDLHVGDAVFAPDGKQVPVIAVTAPYTDSKCYRVMFEEGSEIVAGAGHEWTIRRRVTHRVAPYSDTRSREFVLETHNTEELFKRKTSYPGRRLDVGCSEPLVREEKDLPINPYLLGCWLGDGTSAGARLTCAYEDIQIIEEIRKEGVEIKETASSNANSGFFSFGNGTRGKRGTGLWPEFRRLGLDGNKHLPDVYLAASIPQRMALLQGLMDTDGSCTKKGAAVFCQKDEILSRQVYDLAAGLGFRPRINKYMFLYKGIPFSYYQVGFQVHQDNVPFRLKRKAERAIPVSHYRGIRTIKSITEIPSVPTRCIQVEGGRYLAGRELIPTNNSTIISFALTIQDILNNPELTIAIFSQTRPAAKKVLRQIKQEFEENKSLIALFPDVLYENPSKESQKWSEDDGIIVKRKENPKEATLEAWGLVDGQPAGPHWDIIVYDDVVTKSSVGTPEMIEKTNEMWELSLPLSKVGGRRRYVGTYYRFNDTYHLIQKRSAAVTRMYKATKNGMADGEPVFMSREELDKRFREWGSKTFTIQMLLDPMGADLRGMKKEFLKYWDADNFSNLNTYLLCDPAGEKKRRRGHSPDYTVFILIAYGADENWYLVDMIRDRLTLVERADILFAWHRRYKPMFVGYEKFGKDSDIEHYEDKMTRDNYRFQITPLSSQIPKNDRIDDGLRPKFEQGRIYIPHSILYTNSDGEERDLIEDFINEEYLAFPISSHDDILDCLSMVSYPDVPKWAPSGGGDSFVPNRVHLAVNNSGMPRGWMPNRRVASRSRAWGE